MGSSRGSVMAAIFCAVKPSRDLRCVAVGLYILLMTTTLQKWGNSQGIRVPKTLLSALGIENGAELEMQITPKKDAFIVKLAKPARSIRGRHRIEDLVAAMPKNYNAQELDWGVQGKEVW